MSGRLAWPPKRTLAASRAGHQGARPVGQGRPAKVGARPRLRARDDGIPIGRRAAIGWAAAVRWRAAIGRNAVIGLDRTVEYAHAANCPPASFPRPPAIWRRTRKARSVNGIVPFRI